MIDKRVDSVGPFQRFQTNFQLSSLITSIERKPVQDWAPQQHTEGLLTQCVLIQIWPTQV